MTAETTLPLSVHIGSTPLDRLLFNCPARVTCSQLLQSVQQALPHAVLSHLSTFHHDRIPLEAEMSQYVQAHDAVIAHFMSGQSTQQPSAAALRASAPVNGGAVASVSSPVRVAVAPSSAFAPPYGFPHPPPPPHMMPPPHTTAFSPSHPPMPPPPHMPFMMYGLPPPPLAYHPPPPMHPLPLPPPPASTSARQHPTPAPPAARTGAISMVEACQLATRSVKPALDRYRNTHAAASTFLQSGSNNNNNNNNTAHSSAHLSPTARALLASLKRDEVKRGRKRGFQRVSGDVEAETESEGVSDDESMGSASSWSAVDDEADGGSEDTRATQAAQLIASLSQSPSNSHKRTTVVKLEHDSSHSHSHSHSMSGSRLIRSASPLPTSVFDSTSLLKNKQLKHASVLVLYQAKEEQQRPLSSSLPSTPASLAPLSSPASPSHSMVLSPTSSAVSSPATPSAQSVSSHALLSSPRAATAFPSSHATTSHAAHPPSVSHATVAVAASSLPASVASSAIPTAAHFIPSPSVRHRSRLGIPVMRERRRRRRRTLLPVAATATTTTSSAHPMSANSSYSVAAAIPAMPVTAASPAKAVMAAISYVPNTTAATYQPQQSAVQTQSPAKDKDDKRTYNGKVRVYHNVPINVRTGRVSVHG